MPETPNTRQEAPLQGGIFFAENTVANLPELQEISRCAKQELAALTDSDWEENQSVMRVIAHKGALDRLDPERLQRFAHIQSLLEQAARYQDALSLVRRAGTLAVQ